MEVLHGKENLSRLPLSSPRLWIELAASLHYTFFVLQKIELKHPLSSETLLILRSDQSMAMNNYARDSALKWPQIFISASRQQCRERVRIVGREGGGQVSKLVCINSDVLHGPLSLNRSIRSTAEAQSVSGKDQQRTGQDQEQLPQTHFRRWGHQSPPLWPAGWPRGRIPAEAGALLRRLHR